MSVNSRLVAMARRRDTLVAVAVVGIGLTPAWLFAGWFSVLWQALWLLMGVPAVYFSWRYAPWAPTPSQDLPQILNTLQLKPNQSFCDLGAGDGRMVLWIHAATDASCTGIEVAPLQYLVGRARLAFARKPKTAMLLADIHRADLTGFDVLYMWGTAYWVTTPAFSTQMQSALRPGARLVMYQFPLHGLHPDAVDTTGLRPIYTYTMASSADSSATFQNSEMRTRRGS
jgi:hypothetical protein